MANFTDTDIAVRLAHTHCAIAEAAQTIALKKKYGTAKLCDTNKLLLLLVYERIICGYVTTSDNNLITETELEHIFDMIARIADLCFAPKGYQYFENVPVSSNFNILLNDGTSNILLNDGASTLILN
jgi:hypothetical protein